MFYVKIKKVLNDVMR